MSDTVETPTEPVVIPDFFKGSAEPIVVEAAIEVPATEEPIIEEPAVVVEEPKVVVEEPKIEETPLPRFANEDSERVYNLLASGEVDKALDIFSEQKKLKEADKLPPSDIIKLNLQYQNKDFTPSEIQDLFNESYELPEKPEEYATESEEEFEARLAKYNKEVEKIENRIKRDAKPATVELQKLYKEIVLPNIQKAEPVKNEPTQEELEVQKQWSENFLQSVEEGVKKFNGYEATYKNEEVEVPVAYKMTKEEKAEIQPLIALAGTDAGSFMEKIGWIDKNGNIDTFKLAQDLPLLLNKDKVLAKMVTDTGNELFKEARKSIKNIDYSGAKSGSGDLGESPEQLGKKMVTGFFSKFN